MQCHYATYVVFASLTNLSCIFNIITSDYTNMSQYSDSAHYSEELVISTL